MRRGTVLMTLGLLAALPGLAAAGGLDLRVGGFAPRTRSNLFADDAELYTVGKKDWRGLTGGLEYSARLAPNFEVGVHLDGYGRTVHTSYREFVRDSGREILQSLKLTTVPIGVSFRLVPTGRRARLAPYAAVGADLVYWRYEEFGDFVDFDNPRLPVIADSFEADGVAPGFHVAGGLRIPVSDDFSVTAEVRYLWAKDDMGDDFRGNRLDLSGATATIGLNLRF